MARPEKTKKARPQSQAAGQRAWSPEAQEMRALLRRIPDGLRATLTALASRPAEPRRRVMAELARGLGRESLPLLRAAAMGANEELALSALGVLPTLKSRAAGEVLLEVVEAFPEGERAQEARRSARALQAVGVNISIPGGEETEARPRYELREMLTSSPDGTGARSLVARLQDNYGMWHAILVVWNDEQGVRDGFMRPVSRNEWEERHQGRHWAPCDADFARWQVQQARAMGDEAAAARHLKDWDTHIGPPPVDYQPPDPLAVLDGLSDDERSALLLASKELLTTDEGKRWILDPASCGEWATKWGELEARGRLRGANRDLSQERHALITEAAEALLDEHQRRLWEGRLRDLALTTAWRGRPRHAQLAAVAAATSAAGTSPSEISFYREMIAVTLQVTWTLLSRGQDLGNTRFNRSRR